MSATSKHLLMILAILAVGASQVLGFSRGYLCQCNGDDIMTSSPSCETAAGHAEEHPDTEDHSPCIPHEHQKVTESLKTVSFAPLALMLPALVIIDWPPSVMLGVQAASEVASHEAEKTGPPDDAGGHAPACLEVAETMVMLV